MTTSNFDVLVATVGEIVDAHIEAKVSYANKAIAAWHNEQPTDKRLAEFRQYVLESSLKTVADYTF